MENVTCVKVADLYEACFYLCNDAVIESVEIIKENKRHIAYLTLSGVPDTCQTDYLSAKATVNLFEFRRFYQHVQSHITSAKIQAKKEGRI